MEDKTLLTIIRRMDEMERRLLTRIESLDAFRLKVIGGAMAVSGIISLAFELLKH